MRASLYIFAPSSQCHLLWHPFVFKSCGNCLQNCEEPPSHPSTHPPPLSKGLFFTCGHLGSSMEQRLLYLNRLVHLCKEERFYHFWYFLCQDYDKVYLWMTSMTWSTFEWLLWHGLPLQKGKRSSKSWSFPTWRLPRAKTAADLGSGSRRGNIRFVCFWAFILGCV